MGLCPWLSVEGDRTDEYEHCTDIGKEFIPGVEVGDLKERMQRDGYFVLSPNWGVDIEALRLGVEALAAGGWQASFVSMYDEAWMLPFLLRGVVEATTGGTKLFNCDWLGYHVAPPSESGMPPHRDFPRCPPSSWVDEEQTLPKVVTCWVALSDVDPSNSCLYMLPASKDPLYRSDRCEEAPSVFTTNTSFQDIVALPMKQGDVVCFSHRVFHWGSASTPLAKAPRVALAFGLSEPGFKAPYLEGAVPFPPAPLRAALAAAQMVIYNKRHDGPWPLSNDEQADFSVLAELLEIVRMHEDFFDPTYLSTILASPVIPTLEAFTRNRDRRSLGSHGFHAVEL
eukprot:gene20305-31254_t